MIEVQLEIDGDIVSKVHEDYHGYEIDGVVLEVTSVKTHNDTITYNFDKVVNVTKTSY